MIKKILPAVLLGLSFVSCQMGLTNYKNRDGVTSRASNPTSQDSTMDITYNDKYIFATIDEPANIANLSFYINVDGNSESGFKSWLWKESGADILVQRVKQTDGSFKTSFYNAFDGSDWGDAKFEVEASVENNKVTLKIPFDPESNLIYDNFAKYTFGYVSYSAEGDGWEIATILPAQNNNFTYGTKKLNLEVEDFNFIYDNNYLYASIKEPESIANFDLYINTDENADTGFKSWLWTESGADFLVERTKQSDGTFVTSLYKYNGSNWGTAICTLDCTVENHEVFVKIPFDANSAFVAEKINSFAFGYVSFSSEGDGWQSATVLPEKNKSFVSNNGANITVVDFAAKDSEGNKIEYNNGIIIPAYITGASNWEQIEKTVASFKANNPDKDIFVVLNGVNGPNGFDWETAKDYLGTIKQNCKLIGYVHTCTAEFANENGSFKYRSINGTEDSVIGDIENWIANCNIYGCNLDGIWIDEFYPRYEIAGNYDSTLTFPNGKEFAPTELLKYPKGTNLADEINNLNINPEGGYYWQLITEIMKVHPEFIKIGNAGGMFWSNQMPYGKLVDILVCFEQKYSIAKYGDPRDSSYDASAPEWKRLADSCTVNSEVAHKLALIHGAYDFDVIDSPAFRQKVLKNNTRYEAIRWQLLRIQDSKNNKIYNESDITESSILDKLVVAGEDFRQAASTAYYQAFNYEDFRNEVINEYKSLGISDEAYNAQLVDALMNAEKYGYTHVYVTDRDYGIYGESNVWGGLPSYLNTEVELLANFFNK